MVETLRPETAPAVQQAIEWAAAEATPLEVRGLGSKSALGRPVEATHVLDLSALSGIEAYEASELVLSAGAATPMAEIEATLGEHRQHLAFEPPDLGPLLGRPTGAGSLGGVLACNLAGPRRIQSGAARDHFLGFSAVSGRGEAFKSGGRVVKNVTGFDLSKLMAGSYGTLAVMTEVTVKVLPVAEKTRTVLVRWPSDGVYDHGGMKAMADALGSSHELSAAAHLPAAVAERSGVGLVADSVGGVTALRVEGPGPSVEHRARELRSMLGSYGETEELHTANSAALWREVRDVEYFVEPADRHVWRLSVPPAAGSRVAFKVLEGHPGEVYYDWGGGLIWLALEPLEDLGEEVVRAAADEAGGHATLIRAEPADRARIAVFPQQPQAEFAVTRSIKRNFDPGGVLNPGRMVDGL